MSYQPEAYETALWKWLSAAVGDLVEDIRFANQAQPAAGRAAATLHVISTRSVQTPRVRVVESASVPNTFVYQIEEHRSGTVSVNVFGANHRATIAQIERSMWLPDIVFLNTQNGVEIQQPLSDPQDLTELIQTDYLGRSQQDYGFAYHTIWQAQSAADVIRVANYAGTIDDFSIHQEINHEP